MAAGPTARADARTRRWPDAGERRGSAVRLVDDWTLVAPDRFVDATVVLALGGIESVLAARDPEGLAGPQASAGAGSVSERVNGVRASSPLPLVGMTEAEIARRCRLLLGL